MVAAGLPVCAARAAEVSSGAEFAAALAGGENEIALTRDIVLTSGIGTQTAENMALDGNGHSLTGNNDLDSLSIAKGKTFSAANVGGKYTVSDTAPADGSIYAEFTDTDGQKKYAVSAGGFERLLGSGVASTGVLSNKGMLEVADSAFVGNQVGYGGAGVHNAGLITRLNADFLKNEGSWGAALYNAGVITAFEGDFIGNTAEYYGGAVFNMGEIGTMGGFYAGNTATPYGGALFNGKDAIGNIGTIEKITGIFSGNNAKYGSAIFNDGEVGAVAGLRAAIWAAPFITAERWISAQASLPAMQAATAGRSPAMAPEKLRTAFSGLTGPRRAAPYTATAAAISQTAFLRATKPIPAARYITGRRGWW